MNRILMVSPEYYDVVYAINPHMRDSAGNLNKIDKPMARAQWEYLKNLYSKLGFQVEILPGQPNLPDMVFAANQAFFFDGKILLSNMRSDFRKPEIPFFRNWFKEQGFPIYELESKSVCIEGNGDVLYHAATGRVYGAYGPRTDRAVYQEISKRFGLKVTELELVTEEFYHLDTCFSILSDTAVAIYPAAFGKESLKAIYSAFSTVIPVTLEENKNYFACNCHSPNGKDVILQKGSSQFVEELKRHSFTVHEIDTSEFIKAGGSVFCLKMQLY